MNYIRDTRERVFVINDEYLNGYARLCGINATGVYISLCRHVDKKQTCFPSKRLIAQELDISERAVYNALKVLEEWRIVVIENQGRKADGSFKNNVYILTDKSYWKPKPQAPSADGKKQQLPQANLNNHRRHMVPNKGTHSIKDTHIKDTSFNKNTNAIREQIGDFVKKLKYS